MKPSNDKAPTGRAALRRFVAALMLVFAALAGAGTARAQQVTAADRVVTGVLVRAEPSRDAPVIGVLRRGENLPLRGAISRWREVTLPNGVSGYVSKSWTRVTGAEAPPALAATSYAIHVVDVGTGLAVFVQGPDFALVYDGGSNDDDARGSANRLLAYIKAVSPNLQVIDHMILSHAHTDHVALLDDLFEAYQVRHVWDSGRVNNICGYRRFLKAVAAERGVAYHDALSNFGSRTVTFEASTCDNRPVGMELVTLTPASRISEDSVQLGRGAQLDFLYAVGTGGGSYNNNSVVVRLDLGGTRILFMGDAEAGGGRGLPTVAPTRGSVEGKLLTCCRESLKADILIVGHHGSLTSSRRLFLDAVGARDAIVSSGPHLYSGIQLPDQQVLTELRNHGRLWQTDRDDRACMLAPPKIGPDDKAPGGCDNILIRLGGGPPHIAYNPITD